MKAADPNKFHQLYGVKRTRITYQKKDFLDYLIMTCLTALVICATYGLKNILSLIGVIASAFMVYSFIVRHGIEIKVPVIFKRPLDLVYMVVYKVKNIKLVYLVAITILLLENFLISITPSWPHQVDLMRDLAYALFYIHFFIILSYRSVILWDHLKNKDYVRSVLLETPWKGRIKSQGNITLEIFHAYVTGVLTHIAFIVPWYLVITYFNFSIVLMPLVFVANFITQFQFIKVLNEWYYRDHWLGHNSELDFLYLHGPHHDAIPSALIGVSGNGHLEGVFRSSIGFVISFFNPLAAFIFTTEAIYTDMNMHQYIPGLFPKINKDTERVIQHSTHHYGRLEPYGAAINLNQPNVTLAPETLKTFRFAPDQLRNSISLDEELTGFKWENSRYKWYLNFIDKYQK